MYRPPRTGVAAAVLCAALLLAACESPSSGSAAPGASTDAGKTTGAASSAPVAPSASAEAPSGQIDVGELTRQVSQLDSYQIDITFVDAEGEQTLTIMSTANPKASHYRMGDDLELITIEGQGAWVLEDGAWVDAAGAEQMFVALFDALAPDTVVAGYGLDRYDDVFRPQGTESKNGVQAAHYHLDAEDAARIEGGEDFPEDGAFDIWVAEDGGYLVAMVFAGTDPETGEAVEFRMDVTRVNDPTLVIEAPA